MMQLSTGKYYIYSDVMDTVRVFDNEAAANNYVVRSGCTTFRYISEVNAVQKIMHCVLQWSQRVVLQEYLSTKEQEALNMCRNADTLDDLYSAYLFIN